MHVFTPHRHKHPLHLHYTPAEINVHSLQSTKLIITSRGRGGWDVNTISSLTSWLSVPSCCVSLPDCILILGLPLAKGAGFNKNNNHNCSKITSCLGQWGWGDGWKRNCCEAVVIPESGGETQDEKKEKLEKAGKMGQRVLKSGYGVRWFSSKQKIAQSLYLLLYISVALSLCGMISSDLPLFSLTLPPTLS